MIRAKEYPMSTRAGQYIMQPTGYRAFIPAPLPPEPALNLTPEVIMLLSNADRSLGKLSGLASVISEPDLFVYLYVRKEALLSSQIEGTQCSLEDVLTDEEEIQNDDVKEVSNYVLAMNEGLKSLQNIPVSTRLIKQLHRKLLTDTRGSNKTPGEYRTTQNWIGQPGANLQTAEFIPPPANQIDECMNNLEKFIHENNDLPPLIKAGIAHAQFETIHPFLDGNGRIGRLLITLLLCSWEIMDKPLLYLSYFFKANRTEYYSRLTNIRLKGDWESWIKFFLRGVDESAKMANQAAVEIHDLHKRDAAKLRAANITPATNEIFSLLFKRPRINTWIVNYIVPNYTKPTIQRALNKLVELGILVEVSGKQRNRLYVYREYLNILTRDTSLRAD